MGWEMFGQHIWFEVGVGNLILFGMNVGMAANRSKILFRSYNEMVSNVRQRAKDFTKAFFS